MNQFLSFHERYVPLTDEKPIPTLAETRDRAIAESSDLRQENAELRQALCGMVGFIDLMRCRVSNTVEENEILDTNHRVVRARALLTKVSR